MQLKYVIMEGVCNVLGGADKHEIAFLFPGIVTHADFARFRRHENLEHCRIASAGFVDIGDSVKCHGRSESLNMDSRPEQDAAIIAKMGVSWSTTKVYK